VYTFKEYAKFTKSSNVTAVFQTPLAKEIISEWQIVQEGEIKNHVNTKMDKEPNGNRIIQ
jgi:hypothetical protein